MGGSQPEREGDFGEASRAKYWDETCVKGGIYYRDTRVRNGATLAQSPCATETPERGPNWRTSESKESIHAQASRTCQPEGTSHLRGCFHCGPLSLPSWIFPGHVLAKSLRILEIERRRADYPVDCEDRLAYLADSCSAICFRTAGVSSSPN